MNRPENEARPYLQPMLEGKGRVLHTGGHKLGSTWGYKTAVVLSYEVPAAAHALSPDECRHLYETHEPPTSARVFVFAYRDDAVAATA